MKARSTFLIWSLLLSTFIFDETNAQMNLELRFVNKFTDCAGKFCILQFCFKPMHEASCLINRLLEFQHTDELKPDQLLIPLNSSFPNATIQMEIEHSQTKVIKSSWSGRLSKEWQELDSSGLVFRLQCSSNYFGPSCIRFCNSSKQNVVCDEKTGEKRCAEGYRGFDCMEPIDCNRRCLNGICNSNGECACLPGYEGSDCSIMASTCNALKPCLNDGVCLNRQRGTYECRCAPGFDGPQCERKMATCVHENPCQNGATCEQKLGRPLKCNCLPDYHGTYCQTWARNCSSLPCQNGAHCVAINNTFGCVCNQGFSGKICDKKVEKCSLNTCANGGICLENSQMEGGIECRCKPGYFSTYCEMFVMDCRSSKCLNGGVCHPGISHSHCQCPQGYSGNYCEYRIMPMELKADSSTLAWIIPLCFAVFCFSLITIGGIWFVQSRHRRWIHDYSEAFWANIWLAPHQRQPPKLKPPPIPSSLPTPKVTEKLLEEEESNSTKDGKMGKKEKQILSADALCQNLYVDEPSLCVKVVNDESLCQRKEPNNSQNSQNSQNSRNSQNSQNNSSYYSSVDVLFHNHSTSIPQCADPLSRQIMTLRQTSIVVEDCYGYAEIVNERPE